MRLHTIQERDPLIYMDREGIHITIPTPIVIYGRYRPNLFYRFLGLRRFCVQLNFSYHGCEFFDFGIYLFWEEEPMSDLNSNLFEQLEPSD